MYFLVLVPAATRVARYNALASKAGVAPIGTEAEFMSATAEWAMSLKDELWRACDMPPLEDYLVEHRPYFTSEELDEWLHAGHGIGLHTRTHPFCSRLTDDEVEEEIVRPAAHLRKRIGLGFLPFFYPFGDRLPADKELALLDRGVFDCAFGTGGFAPLGTALHRMERAGVDSMGVG